MLRAVWMIIAAMLSMGASAAWAGCLPTPELPEAMLHYPGADRIPHGNDLARPAGKALTSNGQPIMLVGRVVDRACQPVVGAIVELWQSNTQGIYQVASASSFANPYATFAGAGRAVTNNQGRFEFRSLFPGAEAPGRAPLLHVRVQGKDAGNLATMLYFQEEQRNEQEPALQTISPSQRALLTMAVQPAPNGGLVMTTQIALPGVVPYKRY